MLRVVFFIVFYKRESKKGEKHNLFYVLLFYVLLFYVLLFYVLLFYVLLFYSIGEWLTSLSETSIGL
ncbi:MAG: hypothetical protein H7707_04375, partial [Acetobacter sp.]|nr:hypothetical protein [Acetobacter sp.]